MLELEISEVSKKIREGKISPLELVQATLERIESLNPRLNSFITIVEEQAIAEAKRATEAIFGSPGVRPSPWNSDWSERPFPYQGNQDDIGFQGVS